MLHARGFCGRDNAAALLLGEEEQLLFHCVTGLRHVVLFRWESFRPLSRGCVRDLLMAMGMGLAGGGGGGAGHRLPRTVAMACIGRASSFWKRGWTSLQDSSVSGYASGVPADNDQQSYLESLITTNLLPDMRRFDGGGGGPQRELFAYLDALLASPFEPATAADDLQRRRHLAAMSASFLSLLVGEFTGGNSSARYNLPVEFHRQCHHSFENRENGSGSGNDNGAAGGSNREKSGLDAALHSSMTALSSLVGYILNNADTGAQDELLLELGRSVMDVTCDALL